MRLLFQVPSCLVYGSTRLALKTNNTTPVLYCIISHISTRTHGSIPDAAADPEKDKKASEELPHAPTDNTTLSENGSDALSPLSLSPDNSDCSIRRRLDIDKLLWRDHTSFDPLELLTKRKVEFMKETHKDTAENKKAKASTNPVDVAQAYVDLANKPVIRTEIYDSDHKKPEKLRRHAVYPLGKDMPSTLMHKLNIQFYTDIWKRRRRQGLRIHVLSKLSDLKYLISKGAGDTQLYQYLEDINEMYVSWLLVHSTPLCLRASTCTTLDSKYFNYKPYGKQMPNYTLALSETGRPQLVSRKVGFSADNLSSPHFDSSMYMWKVVSSAVPPGKKRPCRFMNRQRISKINPTIPSWIDYLVDDLGDSQTHALFRVILKSKVPPGTNPMLRSAVEEALVLALNRRGTTLEFTESLRMVTYFLRNRKHVPQLLRIFVHMQPASKTDVGIELTGGEQGFERWNDTASMLISAILKSSGEYVLPWDVLRIWFMNWTPIIQHLCPERRRRFEQGTDLHSYPYWRPNIPGRYRLSSLTLGTIAVNDLLSALVTDGHVKHASELLGFALSEIGVKPSLTMFNILLRGCLSPSPQPKNNLASLKTLPLTNSRSVDLYLVKHEESSQDADRSLTRTALLLHGMERWGLIPDKHTLNVIVTSICIKNMDDILDSVLKIFAEKWGVFPAEHTWAFLKIHGLDLKAHEALDKYS